jgi:hypothetical protein
MRFEFHEKREEDGEGEFEHLLSKIIYDIGYQYSPIIYAYIIPSIDYTVICL